MSKSKKLTEDQVSKEYSDKIKYFESFLKGIMEQISKVLFDNDIKLAFPISNRIKTVESLIRKSSSTIKIKKSILEVQDIVGIRIIVLFRSDANKVKSLLEQEFKIIKVYQTEDRLNDDQFGYRSIHCIISIPVAWTSVPSFHGCEEFTCEIQIRTISQHAWAEASHLLDYKSNIDLPKKLKRTLSRVNALLETVDNEFEALLQEIQNKSTSEIVLNSTELTNFLDSNIPYTKPKEPKAINNVLQKLSDWDINNISKLEEVYSKNIDRANEIHKEIVALITSMDANSSSIEYNSKKYLIGDIKSVKEKKIYFSQIAFLKLLFDLHFKKIK